MKKIPLGISDFKKIRLNPDLLYVDKTALIEEFLEDSTEALLITRPRRFGKTLNLSTIRYFFDKDCSKENRKLFDGLRISQNEKAMAEQGSRPVIYLSFKDCKAIDWHKTEEMIHDFCQKLAVEHLLALEKAESTLLNPILAVSKNQANFADFCNLLLNLTRAYASIGSTPLILIDEYDVPLQSAWTGNYWEEAISFFRNFFSAGFKDNPYLWRGVITGCLRVARESMFTGMNNLKVCGVSSMDYSRHFGFTIAEVNQLIKDYSLLPLKEKIESWYNGYIFGVTEIYNPWSILNLIEQKGQFRNYWMNTSGNDLVKESLGRSGVDAKKDLEDLMGGKSISVPLQEQVVFQEIENSPANLWNFLYFTGYLKAVSIRDTNDVTMIDLKIPNMEVGRIFLDSIQYWFEQKKSLSLLQNLKTCLLNGDEEEFSLIFQRLVLDSLSYFDSNGDEPEKFYHGLVLGLIVSFSDIWHIRSNRESGFGRCDILMTPKDPAHFGIVMELKTHHSTLEANLKATAQRAMDQIEKRQYERELMSQGTVKILKLGIGFLGKKIEVLSKVEDRI